MSGTLARAVRTSYRDDDARDFDTPPQLSLWPLASYEVPRLRQGSDGEKCRTYLTDRFRIVHSSVPLKFSKDQLQYVFERYNHLVFHMVRHSAHRTWTSRAPREDPRFDWSFDLNCFNGPPRRTDT